MFLKELEVYGFKSFAKKTKLTFRDGITGIVGPNGCGKSNLIDAVRWVLGEQNIRSIRGTQITDIIFTGNHQERPLNIAEVSILLDNSQKFFPLDWEEISIKRRIYRSGETENFINGFPCKLKDIQELFMNTGLGRNAYSIIAQGEIEMVLSVKPADRRYLFEEAAAISKYKYDKQKTIKSIEEVETNLNRIGLILSEIESNLDIFAEEAKNLQKYKSFQKEIRDLELYLIFQKYNYYKNNLLRGKKRIEFFKKNREKIITTLQEEETALNILNQELLELNKEKERHIKEEYELENQKNKAKNEHLTLEQKRDDLEKRLFSLKAENEKLHDKIKFLQQNKEDIDLKIVKILEQGEIAQQQISDLKENLEKKMKFVKAISSIRDSNKKSIQEYSKKRLFYREKEIKYHATATILEVNLRKIRNKKNLMNEQIKKLTEDRDRYQKAILESKSKIEAEDMRKVEKKIEEITNILSKLEFLIRNDHQEINLKEERKNILNRLLENSLLLKEEEEKSFIQKYYQNNPGGFCSKLIKLIDYIPAEYEKIIEITLQDKLNVFVVDNVDAQFSIFKYLPKGKAEKLKIIPLQWFDQQRNIVKKETELDIKDENIIGFANELIICKERYKKLFQALLGKILILKDKNTAFNLYQQLVGKYKITTLDGLIIELDGTICWLNSDPQDKESNIFYLEREIGHLNKEIENLKVRIKDQEFDLKENTKKYYLLLQQKENLNLRWKVKEREVKENYDNLNKIVLVLEETKSNLVNLSREEENLIEEKKEMTKKWTLYNSVSNNLEIYHKNIEENLKLVDDLILRRRESLDKMSSKISSLENCVALNQQQMNNLKEKKENFSIYINEYLSDYHSQKDLIEEYKKEIDKIKKSSELLKIQLEDLEDKIDISRKNLIRISNNIQEKMKIFELKKEEKEELQKNLEENKDDYHQEELSVVQYQEKCGIIEGEIINNYKIALQDLEYYKDKSLSQKEANQRIEILKKNILDMGKINFEAENRYQEQLIRYNTFRKSYDEIFQARTLLEKIYQEIDKLAKKRFLEVFEQVRMHFKKFFNELFHGGEAELYLDKNGDILQSGINIIAQPPHKDTRNIELLSSGERSITAIALLLSLWKVNPSPFCFFDEIDTSLDELNADRLSSLLKGEELKKSQLIIITHQKSTIEAADSLYGITMEESGISKVVSVKLNK